MTRDEERLMRYLDGEVDGTELGEIEAWLAASKEARALLESLDLVGQAVRAIGDDVGAGGDGVAAAVMARIALPGADARIVDIGARTGRGRNRTLGRRLLGLAPALGLGLAAAAAVIVYLRPVPPRPGASLRAAAPSVAQVAPGPAAESSEQQPVSALGSEPGASIESVDFGGSAGTIFMVSAGADSDDAETPVVWLMDEVVPAEGRITPL